MSEEYLQMIHNKIIGTNNRWVLMKIENQMEEYIKQNEQILFQNGTIEDILDIRDTIIKRISQLRREEQIKSYTEEGKSKNYKIQQYYCLIEKKNRLEKELHEINNELLVLVK